MNTSKSYTVEEATRKMEGYCAYQDRCHKEVTEKLRSMKMIPAAIDHIIHHLITHNFLNEERFARSFARGKFRVKKWGRVRILRELELRDISIYNQKLAMKEIPEEAYLETLYEIAEKKLNQLDGESELVQKKKLFDYLAYRGWESHLIYEAIHSLIR